MVYCTLCAFLRETCFTAEGASGMEAVSLHDFHATADDELSFKKGSILKVRGRVTGDQGGKGITQTTVYTVSLLSRCSCSSL